MSLKIYDSVSIGAGPAGLTAAYLLLKEKRTVCVLESDSQYVGGISRTVHYKGFHFDIGGHRFFSKSDEVENLWKEILPMDFIHRPRKSRIFYRRKFFSYPLKPFEALFNLGIIESTLCVLSYIKIQIFPYKNPKSFQDWVSNQFGERLFNIFFKTYTEKVWGMNCNEISSDWAAQRIKGLSLFSAVYSALTANLKRKKSSPVIKSLIDSFKYPRKGPGMMWETCAEKILAMGGTISMGSHVTGLEFNEKDHLWTVHFTKNGISELLLARNVISSAPLKELIHGLKPKVSHKTNQSSEKLRYRDFLTVAIIVKDRNIFDDNWIYIHDPSVKVGRIQNFKSWSPELVPHPGQNCYGLEYFCFEHDHLWDMADSDLISLGKKELLYLGLIQEDDVLDGHVVRQKKAYPVYDDDYSFHVDQIKNELTEKYPGLHLVGRNGMHKYNNQDHAMMTAMLTVKNIVNGRQIYDVWNVNQDAEYHEVSSSTSGLRQVPEKIRSSQANV